MEIENYIEIKVNISGSIDGGKRRFIKLFSKNYYKYNSLENSLFYKFLEYKRKLIKVFINEIVGLTGDFYVLMAKSFLTNCDNILLLFSLHNRESLNYIMDILSDNIINPNATVVLVGTYTNIDFREIEYEEGVSLGHRYNFPYLEVDILNGTNIENAYFKLFDIVFKKNPEINYFSYINSPNFYVYCSLNKEAKFYQFLNFMTIQYQTIRLKNFKKYPIIFLTNQYNPNTRIIHGGIYIVNLWEIKDFKSLEYILKNGYLPKVPKMILGIINKKERRIMKKEIRNLALFYKIPYFEIDIKNGEGVEIAFTYLTMEMLSYKDYEKDNSFKIYSEENKPSKTIENQNKKDKIEKKRKEKCIIF